MERNVIKEMIKQYIKELKAALNIANEDLTNIDLKEVSDAARGLSNAINVYEEIV